MAAFIFGLPCSSCLVRVQVVAQAVGIDLASLAVHGRHGGFVVFVQAVDMAVVVVRQITRADKAREHLQEAKAHESAAQGNGAVDQPGRPFEVGRGRPLDQIGDIDPEHIQDAVVRTVLPDEAPAHPRDHAG